MEYEVFNTPLFAIAGSALLPLELQTEFKNEKLQSLSIRQRTLRNIAMAQQRSIFETSNRLNKALEKNRLDDTLLKATIDFDNLQERRDHPPAKQDNGGRRYLTKRFECCEGIRTPSRRFPFSQLLHGRTAIHVAHKHGIEDRTADIRKLRKLIQEYVELQANPALVLNISAAHQARLAIASLEAPAAKKQSKKKKMPSTTCMADEAR